MKLEPKGGVLTSDGQFRFLLGANYWPRKTNLSMWSSWDPESVADDLRRAAELGVRVLRAFLRDLDFSDEAGNLREDAAAKLRQFLDMAEAAGVKVLLTLIVGHMSGKNWPIPWTPNDKIYSPDSIAKTCNFASQLVSRFRDHPAVAGWILSNELSLVSRAPSRDEALNLLRECSRVIKSLDPGHAFSSGDVPDSYMQETPNVRGLVDYVGPHLYLYDNDAVRHGLLYSAAIELFRDLDYPVVLEEFGFSTLQFSEESHARFVEEALYSALAHGASGALVWCLSDFEDRSEPPYEWRPLELGFGLLRADGSPKPAAEAFREFSKALEALEGLGLHSRFKRVAHAAVVVPYYVFADYEFVWYRRALGFWGSVRPSLMSLALASSLGLSPAAVYEGELARAANARVLFMPSVVTALASTWRSLLRYVESGGVLVASVARGFGDLRAYHEAPTQLWRELFGVAPALRAGSEGVRLRGEVVLRSSLRDLEEVAINVPGQILTYSVSPVDAEPLAYVDGLEAPVLLRARRGKGYAYLLTLPIELIVGLQEEPQWGLRGVYAAILRDAGVEVRYASGVPSVETVVYTDGREDLVFAINHSDRQLEASLEMSGRSGARQVAGRARLVAMSSDKAVLLMPPKSSAVILFS